MAELDELDVLFIEDSDTDTRLVVHELRRCGFATSWRRVETAPDLREALYERSWRLVISDSNVPQLGGFEALALTRLIAPTVPFIVVSGSVHPDAARDAALAGADAWISKDDLAPLGDTVRRTLQGERGAEPTPVPGLRRRTAMTLVRVITPIVAAARDVVAEIERTALAPAADRPSHALALLDDAIARLLALGHSLGGADAAADDAAAQLAVLSPRQVQVLRLIAGGLTTREIATALGLSVKTVETHRGQIMERLRIRTVAGLVRYAVRVGLVSTDE